MYRDSALRSVLKTLSWRIIATLATVGLVWAITKEPVAAAWVGSMEAVGKLILYFFHERLWDRLPYGKTTLKTSVLWFTGLSGSGKTTIAKYLLAAFRKKGLPVEWLDGDVTREFLPATGFSKAERDAHVLNAGFMARMLQRNHIFVVASYISPYAETRQKVRAMCDNFIEIYVDTPLEECERRDVKGLYAKVRKGEIKQFTGIDDPYEAPPNPELRIETRGLTVEEAGNRILAYLKI